MILRMMPNFGSAQYAGQGLAHMLSGIMGGQRLRGLDRTESQQRARATGLFDDMMAGDKMAAFDPWFTDLQTWQIKGKMK